MNSELLKKCYLDYKEKKPIYDKMYDYGVAGESDARKKYINNTNRSNLKIKANFIKKFIKEEVSYLLSNKPTYVSYSDNKDIVTFIINKLAHWSSNHDKEVLRDLLNYGEVYELYFAQKKGDEVYFNSKVIAPRDGYVFQDDFGNISFFMRFFKKTFDDTQYIDVYDKDYIYHYNDSFEEVEERTVNIFGVVPVSVGRVSKYKELDTLYNEIKELQDAYETNLSDLVNEISDYRLAYLVAMGCKFEQSDLDKIKTKGIINSKDKDVIIKFLTKDINDQFVQNTLGTLEKQIYAIANHIDTNEKLQSNTSGSALRNRLIGLEQRVRDSEGSMQDINKTRLEFLFKLFKSLEQKDYDYRDIDVKFTLNIPQDDLLVAQVLSQLGIGTNISLETALAQLSFVNNTKREKELIKEERKDINIGLSLLEGSSDE